MPLIGRGFDLYVLTGNLGYPSLVMRIVPRGGKVSHYVVTTNLFPQEGIVLGSVSSYAEALFFSRSGEPTMKLFRYLQHWLTGPGPCLQVADFVPETHPIRQWAETFPWAALVAAIDCSFAQRFPKPTTRGRPPVATRVWLALELLKQELACSDEQICSRLRTDVAVMDCLWDYRDPGGSRPGAFRTPGSARPVSPSARRALDDGIAGDPGRDRDGGRVGQPGAPRSRHFSQ